MAFRVNPVTGELDLVGASTPVVSVDSDKYDYHVAVLAAYDRIAAITYHDVGQATERVNTITCTSAAFPDSDIVKTISYADVGTLNQRITQIDYVGSVFTPQSLRKVFSYTASGIHYSLSGYEYELF
jgi:hypothetical protein